MRPIDFFDTAAECYATRVALVDRSVQITFHELATLSERIASALFELAEESTEPRPVAIFSPNDYRVIACTIGIMRAGAIVMAMHALTGLERNVLYLRQIKPLCVFYHSTLSQAVDAMRSQLSHNTTWICLDRQHGDDKSLSEFISDTGPYTDHWGDVYGNPCRPVYIRQTSGSTGQPKTIVGDVASYAASLTPLQYKLQINDLAPVCLVAMPLSHAAGVHAFAMLTLGATLVISQSFDPVVALRTIQEWRVTHMWLPPTPLYLLIDSPNVSTTDCSSLRLILLGASSPAPERLAHAIRVLGPCIAVNYGQSEAGFLTWLDPTELAAAAGGDHPERLASSGKSMFVSRVAIMSEDGSLMPRGEVGMIVVRGRTVKPYITEFYIEDAQETALSRTREWHRTGDLGYIDENGYLYIVGRQKDFVNVAGVKVSAAEIERVIMEIDGIVECAVIPVHDAVRGEAAKAVLAVRPGAILSERDILAYCRRRLGRLHSPTSVAQWAELPKSSVGKIDKIAIAAHFSDRP